MKRHTPNLFEQQLLSFLERRKGKQIDDELMNSFASYLWRKNVEQQLRLMREMMGRHSKPKPGNPPT